MIVCHERRLIFVKTKKVGGTSLEIALSKFCGPDCIISPIALADEDIRKNNGFRGAQNYMSSNASVGGSMEYFNHMTAAEIHTKVGDEIWGNYKKFTIVRNPYEVLVSKYFWRREKMPFRDFVLELGEDVNENERIAPFFGRNKLDVYLKYENLEAELERNGLGFLVDGMSHIKAKGDLRPINSTVIAMFRGCPELISLVEERCANTLNFFSYESPRFM